MSNGEEPHLYNDSDTIETLPLTCKHTLGTCFQ